MRKDVSQVQNLRIHIFVVIEANSSIIRVLPSRNDSVVMRNLVLHILRLFAWIFFAVRFALDEDVEVWVAGIQFQSFDLSLDEIDLKLNIINNSVCSKNFYSSFMFIYIYFCVHFSFKFQNYWSWGFNINDVTSYTHGHKSRLSCRDTNHSDLLFFCLFHLIVLIRNISIQIL